MVLQCFVENQDIIRFAIQEFQRNNILLPMGIMDNIYLDNIIIYIYIYKCQHIAEESSDP